MRGAKLGQENANAKYSDEEVERIRLLRDKGWAFIKISKALHVPYFTVRAICRFDRRSGIHIKS
ncbi:MAG: hypothetical protein LBJ59_12285 [Zoogloeaceae bacterium]|jgi:hypothetical protein|nr:hypothetical protein [Zoogloeaceae bacterium]